MPCATLLLLLLLEQGQGSRVPYSNVPIHGSNHKEVTLWRELHRGNGKGWQQRHRSVAGQGWVVVQLNTIGATQGHKITLRTNVVVCTSGREGCYGDGFDVKVHLGGGAGGEGGRQAIQKRKVATVANSQQLSMWR